MKPFNSYTKKFVRIGTVLLLLCVLAIGVFLLTKPLETAAQTVRPAENSRLYLPLNFLGASGRPVLGEYILLGWNNIGMHCYNRDFKDLAVLPPYNNLWVQVVKRGDPPEIVTSGIKGELQLPRKHIFCWQIQFLGL